MNNDPALAERAAIVAWMREVALTMEDNGSICFGHIQDLADDIENGIHIQPTPVPEKP